MCTAFLFIIITSKTQVVCLSVCMTETHNRTHSEERAWLRANTYTSVYTQAQAHPDMRAQIPRCREACTVTLTKTNTHSCSTFAYFFPVLLICVTSALFLFCKPLYQRNRLERSRNTLCAFWKSNQLWTGIKIENTAGRYIKCSFACWCPTFLVALHFHLSASIIPVRLLLLPVVFPAVRVDLFQQLSFQKATFYWLATLFGNEKANNRWQIIKLWTVD